MSFAYFFCYILIIVKRETFEDLLAPLYFSMNFFVGFFFCSFNDLNQIA